MHKNALRLSVVALLAMAGAAHAQFTGPSSSQSAYLLPTVGGVTTTSIFTTGDVVGGYTMVGIPDGLGAFQANGAATFTLAMNHEISSGGAVRAHGSSGAFVSQWEINPTTLAVVSGRDQTTSASNVYTWNGSSYVTGTTTWSRFCSGDLAPTSAFYNPATGMGTQDRIYLNGEESGDEGRAFAHVLSGSDSNTSWQLPRVGRQAWENLLASPYAQNSTVVMANDDSTVNGGVYMYVGTRTNTGNAIERAGLTNGNFYGITVAASTQEVRAGNFTSSRFGTYNYGNVANTSGATINTQGAANNVMSWLRPEDGAWDPRPGHQNDYYFVTTDRFNQPGQVGTSRLWHMQFDDITNPTAGGTVTMLLDGSVSGFQMFDNMAIDQLGRIVLLEDVGNNAYLGGVYLYDIASGGFGQVAQHDPSRFLNGAANFITQDEEASGVIDAADILGQGWFLVDTQAHNMLPGELVEGGQLQAMYIPTNIVPTPGAAALALMGVGAVVGRRRR